MNSSTTCSVVTAPVAHDFPFPTCCVCRCPIPPWDLAGEEYRPRHASTCQTNTTNTTGVDAGPGVAGRAQPSQYGVAVVGAGGLPTVPSLGVKGASHRLRRRPRGAALDPEALSARRVAVRAGTACPGEQPPATNREARS